MESNRSVRGLALLLAPALAAACAGSPRGSAEVPVAASSEAAIEGGSDPTEVFAEGAKAGAMTTAAAAVLAGKVVAEGTTAVGRTLGALVTEGARAADDEWAVGERRTRVVAREQAQYTRETAEIGAARTRKANAAPVEAPAPVAVPAPAVVPAPAAAPAPAVDVPATP